MNYSFEFPLKFILLQYQRLPTMASQYLNNFPSGPSFQSDYQRTSTILVKSIANKRAFIPSSLLESQTLLPYYPPPPNNIQYRTQDIWQRALSANPDPHEYIPIVVSTAQGLHARPVAQLTHLQSLESMMTYKGCGDECYRCCPGTLSITIERRSMQ